MIKITGRIFQQHNTLPGYIFISTQDQHIYQLKTTGNYPIKQDSIATGCLVKIRIPKHKPLPELTFGTEYIFAIKTLPYKFTKNNIIYSGCSFMLADICEHNLL